MKQNGFQPRDDGRRWSQQNIGFRRGGWHGPYPRHWRRHRRRHGKAYATAIAVLALVGAASLAVSFLAVLSQLIAR
jgi:hypothetical protein